MQNHEQARNAFESDFSFHEAAIRCREGKDPEGNDIPVSDIPGPLVVCTAFASELYLKSLILRRENSVRGHNLWVLFTEKLIPDERRAIVAEIENYPAPALLAQLERMSEAFRDWRYLYERPTMSLNISALSALALALYRTIRKLEPEWSVNPRFDERISANKDSHLVTVLFHVGADAFRPVSSPEANLVKLEGDNLRLVAPTVNLNDHAAALKAEVRRGPYAKYSSATQALEGWFQLAPSIVARQTRLDLEHHNRKLPRIAAFIKQIVGMFSTISPDK
jgi:hypothetical protein